MTNQNNAAQAADPQTVLSFDERERILCQFMREPINHDREMAIAIESAALAKLRAPVADERAAFKKCHSTIIKALAAIAMADGPDTRHEDDPELLYRSPVMDDVVRIRVALDECSAALASAPVAKPKRAPVDDGICWSSKEIQRRQKEEDEARAAYYHSRASAPVGDAVTPTNADLDAAFNKAVGASVAMEASAPVAGEAQPLGYVMKGREWPNQCYYPSSHKPTDIHNWTPVFDHAAPQASAEPPKLPPGWQLALNLAIDAIENAPPTDWPVNWPAILHGLKDLRAALSASQPTDKDRT